MKPFLKDAELQARKYLPAAGATNYSDAFDLGPDADSRVMAIQVQVPALANHVDTSKTITLTLQESADNVTFTDVAPLHQCQVAGVVSTGSAAAEFWLHAPPGVKRYIRFAQAVPSGDGDNTGGEVAYDLAAYI